MLYIKISSAQTEATRLDIIDMSGRILKSVPARLNNGEQVLQIDMLNLSSGTYLLRTSIAGKMQVQMINKF